MGSQDAIISMLTLWAASTTGIAWDDSYHSRDEAAPLWDPLRHGFTPPASPNLCETTRAAMPSRPPLHVCTHLMVRGWPPSSASRAVMSNSACSARTLSPACVVPGRRAWYDPGAQIACYWRQFA